MKYRKLGHSGLNVSAVSLGTWLTFGGYISDDVAVAIMAAAEECGINFIDTANAYAGGRAEVVIGDWIKARRRDDWVIATKVFFPIGPGPNDKGLSRKHLTEQCHRSLVRLKTDHIDLYQCHRHDPDTPLAETCRTMDDLVRSGKILYWGVSEWPAETIAQACELCRGHGWVLPISNQPKYNLLERGVEGEVLDRCDTAGLGVIPYSPLAQGVLTGKYLPKTTPPERSRAALEREGQWVRPLLTDKVLEAAAAFVNLAGTLNMTSAQLALAWLLSRKAISSVIVGASTPEQLKENAASADVELSRDTMLSLLDVFPSP